MNEATETPPSAAVDTVRRGHRRVRAGTNPACAGTTRPPAVETCGGTDQPRLRGDDAQTLRNLADAGGPTPPARGRQRHDPQRHPRARTNPACAGTTPGRRPRSRPRSDQPRLRGDDVDGGDAEVRVQGPTPPARGRPAGRRAQRRGRGTDPACAGTTHRRPPQRRRQGDQPRLRGDDSRISVLLIVVTGPTPPARGRPPRQRPGGTKTRTNPACAGTTTGPTSARLARADQPRLRGDDDAAFGALADGAGPTPPARGRPGGRAAAAGGRGTNPACAGTTPHSRHRSLSTARES